MAMFADLIQVFGNSNSLPISLVLSLSQTIRGLHWDKVPGDNDKKVAARGILYLLIFQQLGQLVRWSWGFNVLLAPLNERNDLDEYERNSAVEEQRPLLPDSSGPEDQLYEQAGSSGEDDSETHEELGQDVDKTGAPADRASQAEQQISPLRRQQSSLAHTEELPLTIAQTHKAFKASLPPSNGDVKPTNDHLNPLSNNGSKYSAAKTPFFTSLKRGFLWCFAVSKTWIAVSYSKTLKLTDLVFTNLPQAVQFRVRTVLTTFQRILRNTLSFMNPPLWAMLAAIIVASIPQLQAFFFRDGTFFKNSVTSAIEQSSGVAVPLILVVLGGNLARNTLPTPDKSATDEREELQLLIASLISRMLLPFLIMAPLLAVTAKFIPVSILDDPIFVIVCFLITGAPTALQLAQICQINDVYMGTMSRLLFQSYVVWILPSTLILVMCALEVVEWAQR